MRISGRGLNRATLARQLLLRRESVDVAEALRRVVALQAQQPASPYLALWNRISGFAAADLDAAFADHSVVKATLLRITLHAVRAQDYGVFREAMEPTLRSSRLSSRFSVSGVEPAEVDALVPDLLAHLAEPRTGSEVEAWLGERLGGPAHPGAWWGLKGYAPLVHAPTAAPWSFGHRPAFRAAPVRPVLADAESAAAGLRVLVRRYLSAFGPASVADIAQFATVQRARVKAVLDDDLDRLQGPDGTALYDVPGALLPDEDTPAPPRLMAMWDSTLLAYHDRTRLVPAEYRALVTRTNGDVLPTLLVDGRVAGVWRVGDGGVEATAFHPLPEPVWDDLAAEAAGLLAFVADREPRVYNRYGHWWAKLPPADTRVLPA